MKFELTPLADCYKISPTIFEDNRGHFFESYNHKLFAEATGLSTNFIQDNQSRSSNGVLRGLHLQLGDAAQAKLVRAIEGDILDVVVDLRPESSSFKQHYCCILSAENKTQLFVPKGFAHGFMVLSDFATIHYKADNYYTPSSESGLIYNDKDLAIDWRLKDEEVSTSAKDLLLPTLKSFIETNFNL